VIDFKIIEIGSPSAQGFFKKADGIPQMTSHSLRAILQAYHIASIASFGPQGTKPRN